MKIYLIRAKNDIPGLVGAVYAALPPVERGRLLGQLIKPLGLLSLAVIANGVFAKILFRSGTQAFQIPPDETRHVQINDVVALADFVQQVSTDALERVATMLVNSPAISGSVATALLVAMLIKQVKAAQKRRGIKHRLGERRRQEEPQAS